ncbi:MAG: hypothetical protein AAGE52_11535, partial [Myxococcota bacterium]
DDVLTHLVTYVREAAAIIADVCSEEFDAIEAGGIGDLLEAAALRANLKVDRLQLVIQTLSASGIAEELWRSNVA